MIRQVLLVAVLAVSAGVVRAQPATQTPSRTSPTAQTRQGTPFELSEYGVALQPDARLVIMMSALDAAGFDPTPPGKASSAFRQLVRKDQANLDPVLRERLKAFYDRNKLSAPATAADQ